MSQSARDPSSNRFIGRSPELDAIVAFVKAETAGWLALTGPSGRGKSRTARVAATRIRRAGGPPTTIIDLTDVPAAELVLPTVARAFRISGAEPLDQLRRYARAERRVVVLDGIDSAAGDTLRAIRDAMSGTSFIAIGRQGLEGDQQRVVALEPLGERDARRLLAMPRRARSRAGGRRARGEAEAVGRLAAALGGNPLAIELSAASTAASDAAGLVALAEELGAQTPARGSGDLDPALLGILSIEWARLDEACRSILAHLAAFAAGWTMDAATSIIAAEIGDRAVHRSAMATLVDRALIRRVAGRLGERYSMPSAVREYVASRPEAASVLEGARQRVAAWALDLGRSADADLRIGRSSRSWVGRLEPERNNIRSALEWTRRKDPGQFVELVAAYRQYFRATSLEESGIWLEAAVPLMSAHRRDLRADLLEGATLQAWETGRFERADELAAANVSLAREGGAERGLARALLLAGIMAAAVRDHARAIGLYAESRSVAHHIDDHWALALGFYNAAESMRLLGSPEETLPMYDEAIRHGRAARYWQMVGWVTASTGFVALAGQRIEAAEEAFRRCLRLRRPQASRDSLILSLEGMAWIAAKEDQLDLAARLVGAAEFQRDTSGQLLQDNERPFHEDILRALTRVGGPELAAARKAGQAMSAEAAVALALRPRLFRGREDRREAAGTAGAHHP